MSAQSDQELLQDYAERGSEAAFGELVRRYVDFVYSAALRMVRDAQLAEDVTQAVFVALGQNAGRLASHPVMAGWLHRTAQNLAVKAVRTEARRRAREKEAVAMNQPSSSETESAWEKMAPHLDAALGSLKGADRDVVLLRYFQRKSAREIAEALGLSEEAAQKRVARALERLRGAMVARGITVSAALIVSALGAHSVQAAPAGLAAALASASAAGSASAATGLFSSWVKWMAMTKVQATAVGLLFVAGVATPFLVELRGGAPVEKRAGAGGDQRFVSSLRRSGPARPEAGAPLQGSAALVRLASWLAGVDSDAKAARIDDDLRAMVWALAPKDYPQAWGLRERIQSRQLLEKFQDVLLFRFWAKADPRAALAAAQGLSKPERWVNNVFWAWAEKEPAAALAWARELPDAKVRLNLSLVAIEALAGSDPGGAMAALQELPAGLSRERESFRLIERWAEHEPAAAARYVAELPVSSQRSRAFYDVVAGWAKAEPKELIEWAQTLPDNRERATALSEAIKRIATDAPAEAAGLLKSFENTFAENPRAARDCRFALIESWAKSDLPAAMEWVKQLPDGMVRHEVMPSLMEQWGQKDPRGAAEFIAALPGDNQDFMLHRVLSEWYGKDSKAALDWALSQASAPVRESALEAVCGNMAANDGVKAANLVASLSPGELQSKVAVSVAGGWSVQDPKAALAWVALFPEEQLRAEATAVVVSRWSWEEQAAVSRWLETLPEGSVREQATKAYVQAVMFQKPESAARWVSAIPAGPERDKMMETIGRQWLYKDEEAARKWLLQAPLGEEKKRKLMEGK